MAPDKPAHPRSLTAAGLALIIAHVTLTVVVIAVDASIFSIGTA